MKKLYFSRQLLAFICLIGGFSGDIFAQTMPTPQTLPINQKFDDLTAGKTDYPAGFQGYTMTGSPSSAFKTNAALTDKSMGSGTAAIGTGNIYNYDQKLGFLITSSLDFTVCLAFSTSQQTSVQLQYDAMTIRNPYGTTISGTYSDRVNEMILQYRVGTTGAFTSIAETLYSNNTTSQINADAAPQNSKSIKITLPAECDNQGVVQVRWVSRQVSGGGSRPSFAIDNIKVGGDTTAPINETGYPKVAEVLSDGFDFINKINETGKTYFILTASGSAQPTAAQVKAGLDATGAAALQSGSLNITDKALEYSKIFTGLTLNTAYIVYSVSEDSSENLQATVNKLDVTTATILIPSIRTTSTALNFGSVEQNLDSASLNYQIKGTNINAPVTVTAPTNYTVSKDNTTFQTTISFDAVDFASNATPTVYVRFKPSAAGILSGTITHETTGAVSKTVSVSGIGTNPYIQNFDDPNVLSNSGWTQFNVSGPLNKWTYTNVTRNVNSGVGAVLMNGFSDTNAPSKDWLISPKMRLDSFGQFPLLSFYSRKFYAGPSLKLMVSTNYDGVSDPTLATWTEIDGNFPTVTGSYVKSEFINLGAYKTDHTYLAWVYETTAGGTNNASEWSFDDFAITNESGYVSSNPVLDFGDVAQNAVSASQSFAFKADGYGNLTLTAPASYQLSLDNVSFASSIAISSTVAAAGTTLYARFIPTTKELKIFGALTVTGTSLNKQIGSLTGSSLPKADTFDVVTYNLEFFGAPTTAYGPADKTIQLENVAKVMNKLDADVYVVQEVSSDAQIDNLITKINVNGKTFEKTVSTSWSYSWDPTSDPSFPPQKLVVLYNTKTTTLKKTRVMFKEFYDELRAGTKTLANYPGGTNSSFFSSGRLPYMVTLETNLNGVKNEIKLIDLHARANSGTDISRYNMRKYDTQVLKDSLDAHYANSNIILLGDYNDDVKASVIAGQPSSYEAFVNDTNNYKALTLEISQAGAYSFLSSGGFLDHITISNELLDDYIANSTAVYDPRNDIASYTTTTSDHGPVIARFDLKQDVLATPDFGSNKKYLVRAYPNPATDVVNFDLQTTQGRDLKIKLYDINGHVIGNPINVKSESEISTAVMSVHNLVSGFYIYTVTENNKVIFKDKIIKK